MGSNPPPSPLGLLGKIPAQGDFLRWNAAGAGARALDQWLAEGLDALKRSGHKLPQTEVCFLHRAAGAKEVLLGVFVPSADSVGREFPLVVFAVLEAAALAQKFASVPLAYARFLGGASELLRTAATATGVELGERVKALELPGPGDLAAAEETSRQSLRDAPAHAWQLEISGDLASGRQAYALTTFVTACSTAQGAAAPQKAGATIDCPVSTEVGRLAWLELARRLLRWQDAPPALFWTHGSPRLLICVGPAPAAVLSYLARPDHTPAQLWPLQTNNAAALERAGKAIKDTQRRVMDDPAASVDALLNAFPG